MMQPEGFTSSNESKVCKFHRSIYGLKQAFHSWNLWFDRCIKLCDFVGNEVELCIYKWVIGSMIVLLVLFVEDIPLNQNGITTLQGIRSSCHLSSP